MKNSNKALEIKESVPPTKKGKIQFDDEIEHDSITNNIIDKSLSDFKSELYCSICDYSGRANYDYKRHMKSSLHEKNMKKENGEITIKKYICEVDGCEYETYDRSNFNKHKSNKHEKRECKIEKMKRTELHNQASKCKGKMKTIKNEIEKYAYCTTESDKNKKKDLEKQLKETVDLANIYMRAFNDKENGRKVVVKGISTPKVTNKKEPKEELEIIEPPQNKKEEPKEMPIIKVYCIDASEYLVSVKLKDKKRKELVEEAINWLKQEGIDPIEEDIISEDDSIEDKYEKIYDIMSEEPEISLKKFYGVDVKNIKHSEKITKSF